MADNHQLLHNYLVNHEEYGNFLSDKSVAIVGGGPNLNDKKQGALIESYDLVVRVNKAIPIPEDMKTRIGSRCNILYNCLLPTMDCGGPLDHNEFQKAGVQWICSPYPYIEPFIQDISRYIKHPISGHYQFHVIDIYYYLYLANRLGCRPNSGWVAIMDLLQYNIKSLYITGFTFFLGGFYKGYRQQTEADIMKSLNDVGVRGNKTPTHQQRPQIDWMKFIAENDNRISCDLELHQILLDPQKYYSQVT